ncbi:thioredoxin-like protein [Aspergillus vadensis CBS 113365]|uniref:Thioredoxin-like protein n=1 Tax=Aspergillus vadensis (strain CBS 113365 / IMI 142717 / IBT 24658) TaxID=1448311 RepID=A0A319CIB7_ASPVC|nr:thioredoxin-like protein [Aspergillus vadensis CBS 113365]PYH75098.1 thioredoxin-like protein [Aspergillus vadensis CBS 113365]
MPIPSSLFCIYSRIFKPANITKMPLISNFQLPASANLLEVSANKKLFLAFVSSADPATGQAWCPDVRAAWPKIEEAFSGQDGPQVGVVEVGQNPEWKDPQNAYRTRWNVNNIPALVRYESVNGEVVETGRLVEGEILDQEKLNEFIGSR